MLQIQPGYPPFLSHSPSAVHTPHSFSAMFLLKCCLGEKFSEDDLSWWNPPPSFCPFRELSSLHDTIRSWNYLIWVVTCCCSVALLWHSSHIATRFGSELLHSMAGRQFLKTQNCSMNGWKNVYPSCFLWADGHSKHLTLVLHHS